LKNALKIASVIIKKSRGRICAVNF